MKRGTPEAGIVRRFASKLGLGSAEPWLRSVGAALVLLLPAVSARAADAIWDGDTSGAWRLNSNWNAGYPNDWSHDATFDGPGNGNTSIDISGNHVRVDRVFFRTADTAAYTFSGSHQLRVSRGISLDADVTNDQVFSLSVRPRTNRSTTYRNDSTSGVLKFTSQMTTDWEGSGVANLIFAGAGEIEANRINDRDPAPGGNRTTSVEIDGPGTVTIYGNNNYSKGTRIDGGQLVARHDNALGEGLVDLNGSADGSYLTLDNNINVPNELDFGGTNGTTQNATLRNLAGDNTWSGNLRLQMGGGRHYVEVDAGSLTIAGDVAQQNGTGGRSLDLGGPGDGEVSGAISNGTADTFGVNKRGAGTWTLSSSANTYNGSTNVYEGTLLVNGTHTGGDTYTVASGATLGGSGTVGGATTISGHHTPGTSPGIQTFSSDLTYSGGAADVTWELLKNTATQESPAVFDQILVGGDLDFAGATTLNLSFDATGSTVDWTHNLWDSSQQWLLYGVTGTTADLSSLSIVTVNWQDSIGALFDTVLSGSSFSLSQTDQDVYLNYAPGAATIIPEPSTVLIWSLLAVLGITAGWYRGRKG